MNYEFHKFVFDLRRLQNIKVVLYNFEQVEEVKKEVNIERKICTYCGMEGHRASNCPNR